MKKLLIFILVLMQCPACGGGTSGTSELSGVRTQRVFTGTVSDQQNQPIENAEVELEGQSSVTDRNGIFNLSAEVPAKNNKLKVSSNINSRTVDLPNLSQSRSAVQLTISISEQDISVSNIELILQSITGKGCENAFEDLKIFKLNNNSTPLLIADQILPIATNTKCYANVSILANGKPANNIGMDMYFSPTPIGPGAPIATTVLVAEQNTNINGETVFEFTPNSPLHGPGYFILEAPSSEPFSSRAAVVINPLLRE